MLKSLFGWLFGWKQKPKEPTPPPTPPSPPIDLGGGSDPGIPTNTNGEIELGHLDPIVPALKLSPAMATLLHSPDDVIDVGVMNDPMSDWTQGLVNPFTSEPKDADGEPACGPYTKGGDAFLGKGVVPVKTIFLGMAKNKQAAGKLAEAGALARLANELSEAVWVKRPAMQFNIDGKPGNRIVFFRNETSTLANDNVDIDKIIEEAGKRHLRLIKQYVHFSADRDYTNYDMGAENQSDIGWPNAQGYRIQDLLMPSIGVAGASHVGSWSSGVIGGKPVTLVSDWGHETKGTCDYPANIFAIDYQAGCRDLIPEVALKAYKNNADMWDAIASMQVPFSEGSSGSDEARFQSYNYNPLECHDLESTIQVARKIAELDFPSFNKEYGAFYCSEGVWSIANFGPLADTLIKKSNFDANSPLHKLIVTYQEAYNTPECAGWTDEQKRANPQVGWKHLVDLGDSNGGLSARQMNRLKYYSPGETDGHLNRFGVYLDFIPESIKGWEEYRPKNPEGLIARPLSISTVVWATLRSYLPREAVAKAIAQDIGRAYVNAVAKNDVEVQAIIKGLLKNADPSTTQGQMALAGVGAMAASGWIIAVLSNEKVKGAILGQAGGTYIKIPSDTADKDNYPSFKDNPRDWLERWEQIKTTDDYKVLSDVYNKFINTLKDPAINTQEKLDKRLMQLDEEARAIKVNWNIPNHVDGAVYERATLLKFVMPACWSFWAQQDIYSSPTSVRYVGTAIRDYYKKAV